MALEELIGKVLDEKYRLDEKLGQGGMGAVYLATHLGTERPVAVKIIAPQFMRHPEFVERFRREAKAAGRLRHPNVVDVTDFGFAQIEKERIAYLVMEYLDGCTLSEVLNEEGKLPLKFTVDILEQVCSAIDAAHQQGIIHRDLKPDNIWLEPDGCGGHNVKVLDFGLAKLGEVQTRPNSEIAIIDPQEPCIIQKIFTKNECEAGVQQILAPIPISSTTSSVATAVTSIKGNPEFKGVSSGLEFSESPTKVQSVLDDDETKTKVQLTRNTANPVEKTAMVTHIGTVLGTPIYMSPEQCRGEKLDARSDIYSLGIIAYQMLTGQTPFNGDTQTLITQHTGALPQHLRILRRDIPKATASLIMSTLAKNPAERPASVIAFSSALRARSEGALTVLKQAVSLYNNNFSMFFKLSTIAYLPIIVFSVLMKLNAIFGARVFSEQMVVILHAVTGSFLSISAIFTEAVIHSAFVLAVAQILITPFKSISLRQIFLEIKRKLIPIFTTSLLYQLYACLWTLLFIIPGIKAKIDYILFNPIIMIEGLKNHSALVRSKTLVKRLPFITLKVIAIKAFIFSLMFINFTAVTKTSVIEGAQVSVRLLSPPILSLLGIILVTPILSIGVTLLYFKLRQAGGETLKESLGQFGEETPKSKWQMKMRNNSKFNNKLNTSKL